MDRAGEQRVRHPSQYDERTLGNFTVFGKNREYGFWTQGEVASPCVQCMIKQN